MIKIKPIIRTTETPGQLGYVIDGVATKAEYLGVIKRRGMARNALS